MASTPPDYGYGPVNYTEKGGGDPFDSFDNRIRYNEMLRHQMVSQYQQNVVRPSTMTLSQARAVASKSRYNYGVQGGQDIRMYERQAELSRMSFGSTLAGGMMDVGAYGIAESALNLAKFGTVAKFTLPLAASMVPMHFVNQGVQNSMERRRYMQGIASDVEQYRDKLGFSGGLSYNQASRLGESMQKSMYSPGQFFSKDQQMDIHKIAISNNLISAAGKGANSGSISQYKKNFEELRSTTEEVVKLLQTTIEGGMSVIKELQQSGFKNIKQIRQQVMQSKTLGSMTGLGAQNMMQLGAAGAQAVQGTPYAAHVGASMYQLGAAEASTVARSGRAGSYAVERVGGVAAAGAAIGNFAMNMLQTGMGTKFAAYSMKSDGSVDESKLERALSGKAGGYEISTGANQTGYGMGENRVRFGMFKEDLYNQMSDKQRMSMVQSMFAAWSKERPYSSFKNRAYVFAGLGTNDPRERRLIYQSLLTPKDYGRMEAQGSVERALVNESAGSERGIGAAINRGWNNAVTRPFNDLGDVITESAAGAMNISSKIFGGIESGIGYAVEGAAKGLGIVGPQGFINRSNPADMRSSYENLYGLRDATGVQRAALSRATVHDLKSSEISPTKIGFNAESVMERWKKRGDSDYAIQQLSIAAGSGGWDELAKNTKFLGGFDAKEISQIKLNPQAAILEFTTGLHKYEKSVNKKYDSAVAAMSSKEMEARSPEQRRVDDSTILRARNMRAAGKVFEFDDKLSAGSIDTKERTTTSRGLVFGNLGATGYVGTNSFTWESTVLGSEGVSKAAMNLIKAEASKENTKAFDDTTIEGIRNAAKTDTSMDFTKELGLGERDLTLRWDKPFYESFRISKYLNPSKAKAARKLAKGFDLDTEKGQGDFAVNLLRAKGSDAAEDVELTRKAQKTLTNYSDIIDKAEKQVAAQGKVVAEAAANQFIGGLDSEELKKLGKKGEVLKGLIRKSTQRPLDKDEFRKMGAFKDVLKSSSDGDWEALLKTPQSLYSFLSTKTIDEEKSPQAKNLDRIKKEISGLVEAFKADAGKVKVTDKDGKEEELNISTKKGRRQGQAYLDDLKSQREQAEQYKPDTHGNTMNAIVKPPILNYWDNRWTL